MSNLIEKIAIAEKVEQELIDLITAMSVSEQQKLIEQLKKEITNDRD